MFRPIFTATVPEGWHIRSGLDYSDPSGSIRVSIFEEPVPVEFTNEAYAAAYGELFEHHFPGYQELALSPHATALSGLACAVRRLSWQPPQGLSLVQTQAYLALGGRGVVATASGAQEVYAQRHAELDAALDYATLGPIHFAPGAPVVADGTAAGRFDEGLLALEPAEDREVEAIELVCSIDELAAFARCFGLASYPGVPDALDGLTEEIAGHRLQAARRSLRARGLVDIRAGRAVGAATTRPLVGILDAEFMLTMESADMAGTSKCVWYGSTDDYVGLTALDGGLVHIRPLARSGVVGEIRAVLRDGAGQPRSGRIAWLRRNGRRYDGATLEWKRDSSGLIAETGSAVEGDPANPADFASHLDDVISWPS